MSSLSITICKYASIFDFRGKDSHYNVTERWLVNSSCCSKNNLNTSAVLRMKKRWEKGQSFLRKVGTGRTRGRCSFLNYIRANPFDSARKSLSATVLERII